MSKKFSPSEEALVKGLVHLIWADGQISDQERELLGSILTGLGFDQRQVKEVAKMMVSPPELGNLKKSVPDPQARLDIMRTLVSVALAQGGVDPSEVHFLDTMAELLDIGQEELEVMVQEVIAALGVEPR